MVSGHPEAAQVMRQPVGVRIERRVAQGALAIDHRDRVGVRAACAANSSGSVA